MTDQPFYDSLGTAEKKSVECIYKLKGKEGSLNEIALEFLSQKLAFEETIKKESFEIVEDVSKIYPGKIAFLTKNATLVILGRLNGVYRPIHSSRIYNDKLKLNGESGELWGSFEMYDQPIIKIKNQDYSRKYTPVICLAKTMDTRNYNEVSFTQVISDMTKTVHGFRKDPSKMTNRLENMVIDK